MQSPLRCNKRTGHYGPANNPVSCTAYRAENVNLGNFETVENNGTAFALKQCLYQKVALRMENPETHSPSQWNKRSGRYGPANNHVSCTAYRAENGNLGNFEAVGNNGTAFPPKQCLYQKVGVVMENRKCNRLRGAIKALGVTVRQITRFHAPRKGRRMEIWETSKLSKTMITPLHQSNVYIKR